jgi:hypothetical protein
MENISSKADFLRSEYTQILLRLEVDTPRRWGKMNVQQMIEHMSDYVRIASGKTSMDIVTPEEKLPRMQGFLTSEKPFPENTPNALMPDEPAASRHPNTHDAVKELQQEIDDFFAAYAIDPNRQTPNPFFGMLDFEHQVQLLHKHATHHLRQFGVNP